MDEKWVQPDQNSIEAIAHGMTHADGSEFDVRLTTDGELVLHHNARIELSRKNERTEGLEIFVEQNHSDDLREAGFELLSELIEDSRIIDTWINGSSTACIEIKRPHPKAKIVGGYFHRNGMREHIQKIMKNIEDLLTPLEIPERNTVIYSFDPETMEAHSSSGINIPAAPINPSIRPWGLAPIRRAMALPSFGRRNVIQMVHHWKKMGTPVLPLALKHIYSWSKYLHLGRPYSYKGKSVVTLNKQRQGFPIHVWPTPIEIEKKIISGGFTALSDLMDPTILRTPQGQTRWMKPGTHPLTAEIDAMMTKPTDDENARELFKQASQEPTWDEMDLKERQALIDRLKPRLFWPEITADEGSPPWEMPRFIGHRGAGKTYKEG